jgi:release factor glutamine methyltransferase
MAQWPPMPSLLQLQQEAARSGLARIDAQMLLLHACQREANDRAWLIAHGDDEISLAQLATWQSAVKRRLNGEPVAYILGQKAFYGFSLKITPAVLDPRDDTETLVDWALELTPADRPVKVLDLGTGSGAVALAIAAQRPLAQVAATDASPEALAVARANSAALDIPVNFIAANASEPNWFSALGNQVFDLIVSNPPYIAEGDAHLADLKHEPAMALTSGSDGLDAIRNIIKHAPKHLTPGGWLLLEHGYDQAERVRSLFTAHGFVDATTRQDLSGVDRCTGALLDSSAS